MTDSVEFDTYKGHPIIKIPTGELKGETQYLSMGYRKAKACLDYFDDIQAFCERCEEQGEK